MGIVNRQNNFIGSTSAKASEVNEDFNNLYNEFNGGIDENNINFARAELKAEFLSALKEVDGTGSNLDADLLDGKEYSEIISETKSYTDTAETNANDYADTVADTAETNANLYTDTAETNANLYTDTAETNANLYTDTAETNANLYTDTAETNANDYADTVADTAETNAKDYTDTAETNAKDYANSLVGAVVPPGIITLWSGSTTPTGWALCNGSNGTPDLRDRFVVGAGSSYDVGDTGGNDNVSLSEANLPSHSHGDGSLATNTTGGHYHSWSDISSSSGYHSHSGSTNTTGNHYHKVTRTYVAKGDGSYVGSIDHDGTDSVNTSTAGDHFHSLSINSNGSHTHYVGGNTSSEGSHSHTISGSTGATGGGSSHENRPPYYALAYIMKI